MASPLDHDPTLPHYWSEHPRDKAFKANCNALSSKLTGFYLLRKNSAGSEKHSPH
jgi:hypothetical protein